MGLRGRCCFADEIGLPHSRIEASLGGSAIPNDARAGLAGGYMRLSPKTAPPARAAPTWLRNTAAAGPLLPECWGEPASVVTILLLFFMLILVDTDGYAANWLHHLWIR